MLLKRFIPCLLLKRRGLVKTINFKNPAYIGDPVNTVRIFNENKVDELMFLDISASPENTEPNFKLLEEIANECFMPLSYGGGITSFEQAQKLFRIGIEKLVINSGAHNNLDLVRKISEHYGRQSLIGSVDVQKNFLGRNTIVFLSATRKSEFSVLEWIGKLEEAGVGELLLTSVEREGTWKGLDIKLIREVTETTKVPVIAHGGAGNMDDLHEAVTTGGANAVAMGSMVVYQKKGFGVLVNFPELEHLRALT